MGLQYTVTKIVSVSPPVIEPEIEAPVVVPPEQPQKDAILQINSANVKGEPGTGFEKRIQEGKDKKDFACWNCEYFDANRCGQEDMKRLSQQPKADDGRVIVDSDDCCDYIERVGRDLDGD